MVKNKADGLEMRTAGHQAYRVIERSALPVDTIEMARYLVGRIVVRETADGVLSGRIVETEAYPVGDAASHAFRGMTPRTQPMFLGPGHAYVYFSYGMHEMLNVSSEPAGVGAGVLIRALEPLEGLALMQRNRPAVRERDLTRGPGRLTAALDIDRRLDGLDLCRTGPLWLADDGAQAPDLGASVRIGISKETERPWRFYALGSRFLSGPKALNEGLG